MSNILDNIKDIKDVKKMDFETCEVLSQELRTFLIENVSKTGGHLASNLGVVELTLSLFKVFDFYKDRIVWDVGHQAYVYKILTGRKDKFITLRKFGGISGFPKRCESNFDHFETGHSSTSLSVALGMAKARDLKKENHNVIAVIGDGALTGGMALEALNQAGFTKTNMIIVLNDNQMSIGKNVGGVSTYLSTIRSAPKYNKLKEDVETVLRRIPNIGKGVANSIEKIKNGIKQLVVPGMMFEDMGIKYFGPIDGHNIKETTKVLSQARNIKGPVLIHVVTQKGKGYEFAEKRPDKFHGIGPFNCDSGEVCSNNMVTYSKAFGDSMLKIAEKNPQVVAITAAMRDGTGLKEFSEKYPNRFIDVGIAEQHAVTLAAGMASQGLRPVFAVYSTFLQRAYDQVLHDVCIQKLPVILAIDRAGIVGEDGETHQGIFDISYLSHIPNITILAPKCVDEIEYILKWAFKQQYPIAIRYPRGGDSKNVAMSPKTDFEYGRWESIYDKGEVAILASGKMVATAVQVREKLRLNGIDVKVVNCCFIKPIDKELLNFLAKENVKIITLEDNLISGGLGSSVLQYVSSISKNISVLNLGFSDEFIPHGAPDILYKLHKLDVDGVMESILKIV